MLSGAPRLSLRCAGDRLGRRVLGTERQPSCAAGFVVAALLVAAAFAVGLWVDSLGGPKMLRERFGILAPLGCLAVLALTNLQPLPGGEVLLVGQGALFGFWMGAAINGTASLLAASIRFHLSRRIASDLAWKSSQQRLPAGLARLPIGHFLFQLGVRQLPMGALLVDVASGATGVSRARHHLCAAIGCLPGSLLFAAIGAGWMRLS